MVSPHKVVLKLDYPLDVLWIVFLKQQQQLRLHCCLVVVFFLVLNHLDGDKLARLVVFAFEYLPKCAFANELKQLKSVGDLVPCHDPIVALLIIEPVVDQSLQLGRLILVRSEIVNLLVLTDFSLLVAAQKILYRRVGCTLLALEREFDLVSQRSLVFELD